jgi:hypothetical protein
MCGAECKKGSMLSTNSPSLDNLEGDHFFDKFHANVPLCGTVMHADPKSNQTRWVSRTYLAGVYPHALCVKLSGLLASVAPPNAYGGCPSWSSKWLSDLASAAHHGLRAERWPTSLSRAIGAPRPADHSGCSVSSHLADGSCEAATQHISSKPIAFGHLGREELNEIEESGRPWTVSQSQPPRRTPCCDTKL